MLYVEGKSSAEKMLLFSQVSVSKMMSGSEFSTSTSVSRTLFLMLWKLRDINLKVFRFCAFGGAGSLIGDDVAHGLPIEEHGLHGASGYVVERLLYELSSTEMEL